MIETLAIELQNSCGLTSVTIWSVHHVVFTAVVEIHMMFEVARWLASRCGCASCAIYDSSRLVVAQRRRWPQPQKFIASLNSRWLSLDVEWSDLHTRWLLMWRVGVLDGKHTCMPKSYVNLYGRLSVLDCM
jgi:hypothetical protein